MRTRISLILLVSTVLTAGLLARLADSGSSTGTAPSHDRSLSAPIVTVATAETAYAGAYAVSSLDVPPSVTEHGLPRLNTVPGSLEAAVQAFEEGEYRTPSTRRTDPGVSLEDAIEAVKSEQTTSVADTDIFANPFGKLK